MASFQAKVKTSFRRVKEDIINMSEWINFLKSNQDELYEQIGQLKQEINNLRHYNGILVGSNSSKKVHTDNCPFAKNISSNHKVEFPSIESATASGYAPCRCIA